MERNLEGKIAIVTGASRGIGKAIVKRLADAGATVVAVARSIEECDGAALCMKVDVSDSASVNAWLNVTSCPTVSTTPPAAPTSNLVRVPFLTNVAVFSVVLSVPPFSLNVRFVPYAVGVMHRTESVPPLRRSSPLFPPFLGK